MQLPVRLTEQTTLPGTGFHFYWCPRCGKLYWNGSHGRKLQERIVNGNREKLEDRVPK